MHLALIDWIIIVVYLAGCMTAGIWMRRYVRGVEDFAIAGREMDVNLGIASLAATELGLVTIMYTAQLGYDKGFAGRRSASSWRWRCIWSGARVSSSSPCVLPA